MSSSNELMHISSKVYVETGGKLGVYKFNEAYYIIDKSKQIYVIAFDLASLEFLYLQLDHTKLL